MRISQVTPGLISIPPKGWGAIEKVIWNYKLELEKLGHQCSIDYLDDVKVDEVDIVHIHVANLAIIAQERGIPYIFSLHDHHVVRHGKESYVYQENLKAIKGSIISYTHAEFLVDYFEETDKLFYLSHGVDTSFFTSNETPTHNDGHKLLCVANNGYADDQTYDRKGFRFAVEAAMRLDLPITVVGPPNNMNFFNANQDLLNYKKLSLITENPNDDELVNLYKAHTIFLHPSELEAGHPNLTLLESLSCSLPIVGCYLGSRPINSMIRIERNTDSVVQGITHMIENYEHYWGQTLFDRQRYDWSVIVQRLSLMLQTIQEIKKPYTSEITKELYIKNFEQPFGPKYEINVSYLEGPKVEINGEGDEEFKVKFIDDDTSKVIYESTIKPNHWCKSSIQYFVNWKIQVYHNNTLIYEEKVNFKNQRVYLHIDSSSLGDNIAWMPYIEEFRKKHECQVVVSTFKNFLFEKKYPDLEFVEPGVTVHNLKAMYKIGWFYNKLMEPKLPNTVNLQEQACLILGLDYKEIKTEIDFIPRHRPCDEKYVVIATASTAGCKLWNYENGWFELTEILKLKGYRVINISKEGNDITNAETLQDTSLENTMNVICHSEFLIGLSSGLSWLSWALGKHVVMISNFTEDDHEFSGNCTRIVNKTVCHGCWNNPMFLFDRGDWYWCPEHKDTDRHFECHKSITPNMVIEQIQHLL